ncbi:uncharacterized protein LOC132745669 [Ruditapes philippinarum]|uniref:uncharacterized protein LOC132745669 n=1 Tax=Ruditapes philippinarum TaxID=129788 RepID=UPI00295AFE98|nr:uncharacterized protein LOC132745669 [Ruditapes philippinarum]
MFHEVKGKNITFDKNRTTAIWSPVQTGGLLFTEKPLTISDPVTLTLQGSGAVELGITQVDPGTLRGKVPESSSQLEKYHFLNDVKIHKRTCAMCIRVDEVAREVVSSYGGGQYKQGIDLNEQYWLVADVKYGAVDLKLDNSGNNHIRHLFSELCGGNIKVLNDPTAATSQTKSPAALCFYSEPVETQKQYVLHCSPKAYHGTIPGRYYVLMRYTNQSPLEFRRHNEDKFDILNQRESLSSSKPDWFQIEKFEKDDCAGNPIIVEFTGDSFIYKTASGKRSRQNCRANTDSEVWLVFELYGISARLEIINISNRHVVGGGCTNVSLTQGGNLAVTCIREETENDINNIPSNNSENDLTGSYTASGYNIPGPVRHPDLVTQAASQIDDPVSLEKAIQKNFTTLRDSFIVDEFIDNMFENEVITRTEFQQLELVCQQDKTKATKKVLMSLSLRPVSKKFIMTALEKTKQQFLAQYFFPEEEKE